jgi:hypothetical protein
MHAPARLAACLALACATACSPPVEPPDERPPEPQAAAMRDTVQAPIDAAKVVGDTAQDVARRRADAAEDAGAAAARTP